MGDQGWGGGTRRELLIRTGQLGLGALGAAGLSTVGFSSVAAARSPGGIRGVELTDFPFFSNLEQTMTPAQGLLEELAVTYGRTEAMPSMERFLFGWAPQQLFERFLAPGGAADNLDEALWVMHLAGYFGGIWLRLKFIEFSGPRFGRQPSSASFNALAGRLSTATAAAEGSDSNAFDYTRLSLRMGQQVGLADSYGYNSGYLDQILTSSKPENVTAPSNVFWFTDAGLFDATYGSRETRFLARWKNLARPTPAGRRSSLGAIIEGTGGSDDLREIQRLGVERGRFTWRRANTALSIANWDQPSYDDLVATSVVFLQTIQLTGCAAIAALGAERSDWARQAARGHALLAPYGSSYGVGLFDPTWDSTPLADALPAFRY